MLRTRVHGHEIIQEPPFSTTAIHFDDGCYAESFLQYESPDGHTRTILVSPSDENCPIHASRHERTYVDTNLKLATLDFAVVVASAY